VVRWDRVEAVWFWSRYGARRGVDRVEPQFDQVAQTPYTLLVRALVALIRHA